MHNSITWRARSPFNLVSPNKKYPKKFSVIVIVPNVRMSRFRIPPSPAYIWTPTSPSLCCFFVSSPFCLLHSSHLWSLWSLSVYSSILLLLPPPLERMPPSRAKSALGSPGDGKSDTRSLSSQQSIGLDGASPFGGAGAYISRMYDIVQIALLCRQHRALLLSKMPNCSELYFPFACLKPGRSPPNAEID